jgi:tetratricopeptide (TPR) repeat protein
VTDDSVEPWDVLECLASLVEKSMVLAEHTDDDTTRYRLLETLRAFAREQLDAADDTDQWRRRHAGYFAEFCERAGPELLGPDELVWVSRVEAELDNLRAVLRWGLDAPSQGDADLALRIVIALAGDMSRGRWELLGWADALLARARSSDLVERSVVIVAAADWLMLRDELDGAERLVREALELQAGSSITIDWGYFVLGSARFRQGRSADALALLAEGLQALDAVQSEQPRRGRPTSLHGLASLFHLSLGDLDSARTEAEAGLALARTSANPSMLAGALAYAGRAWFSEQPDAALAAFEESIALTRAGAADGFHSQALGGAAQLRARRGDRSTALALLRAAISYDHDVGVRVNLGLTVERAIAILASIGDDELAATCAGIVQSQTITTFRSLPHVDRTATRVADRLGHDAYQTAFARGASLAYQDVAPALLADLDHYLATPHHT